METTYFGQRLRLRPGRKRNRGSIPGKNKKLIFLSYQTGLGNPQHLTRELFQGVKQLRYKADRSAPMFFDIQRTVHRDIFL
jgi:hypothetical protein